MRHPKGTRARVLLSSVFKPFAQDDEYRLARAQSGRAVPQPGDEGAGPVLAAHVPPQLGPHVHSPEHLGAFDAARLSDARTLRPGADGARVRHRRHLVDRRERRQGPGNVPPGAPALAAIDDRGRRPRDGDSGDRARRSTPTTSSGAKAWPGCARSSAKTPTRPFVHPLIPSSFGFRLMGVPSPRGGGSPSATIVPSVGCPLGCNFCTTSAFFGGKGKFVNFYQSGEELFRVMCEAERELGVSSFFMMDENFLLYKRRAHGTARLHEGARARPGRCTCSRRRTRFASTTSASSSSSASSGSGSGLESSADRLREAEGHGHAGARAGAAGARHLRARLDDHRPRAPHAGEHRRRHRSRRRPRHGLSSVHALHADAGHRRCTRRSRRKAGCSRTSTWRTPTASSSSTSGTRRSRGTSRRRCSTVRSAWTSSATGRAFSG